MLKQVYFLTLNIFFTHFYFQSMILNIYKNNKKILNSFLDIKSLQWKLRKWCQKTIKKLKQPMAKFVFLNY